MAQQAENVTVPLAQGGPITDETLTQLIAAAEDLAAGRLDEIGGHFLVQNLSPALTELQKRRAVMGAMAGLASMENVTVLEEHRQ